MSIQVNEALVAVKGNRQHAVKAALGKKQVHFLGSVAGVRAYRKKPQIILWTRPAYETTGIF